MTRNDDTDGCLTAAHVKRLLLVERRSDWGGGLELRDDGIYRRALDEAVLETLPLRDQDTALGRGAGLVLRLPCGFDQLEQFVASEGLADRWVLRRISLLRAMACARTTQDGGRQPLPAPPLRRRTGHLEAVFKMARGKATDPDDWAACWTALVELAQSNERPTPLLGFAEGDVKYLAPSGEVAFLKREQFRHRFRYRFRSRR
jgi:hypothetical protein